MKKILLPLSLLFLALPIGLYTYHQNTSDTALLHSLSNELFEQALLDNTINLHYTLTKPASIGITDYPVTLGTYSAAEFENQAFLTENALHTLSSISRSELKEEDTLTYDVLNHYLNLQLKSSDYSLYPEPLSASGIQTELPILLAEYAFRNEQDVQDYLSLISCIPDYFDDLCCYETEKANAGLFMSDTSLDAVLTGCDSIMASKESHFLQIAFEERIHSLSSINMQEKKDYIKQHKDLLQQDFFPAYQKMTEHLSSLKGMGRNPYGLFYHDEGKAYYEYLVLAGTGTDYTPSEIKQMLLTQFKSDYTELSALLADNPALSDSIEEITSPFTTPEEILSDLYQKTRRDFPVPSQTHSDDTSAFAVKYVDASMESFMSPAFYLTPPIDLIEENTIYINDISSYSDVGLYTTLAHEGYPGHMLQNTYYLSLDPPPIRSLLYFGGYSEGWAVYMEQYAYTLTGLEDDLVRVMQLDHSLQLCICSLLDIMIHYEGLTEEEMMQYALKLNPSMNQDVLADIYQRIVNEPANYLKYYVGYLEMCRLRLYAEKALGDRFVLKEFHEFLLSVGPAPFPIIEKREEAWIQAILSHHIVFLSHPSMSSLSSFGTCSSIVSS